MKFLIILLFFLRLLPLAGQNSISLLPENVYLSTDRNLYIAGEWLYFNLFLNTTSISDCKSTSKYAYIVIRNVKNNHVSENIVELKDKVSFGSIYLPDTLETGFYQILGYTNYMRNFGESSFFTKDIVVVNRFDKELNFFDPYMSGKSVENIRNIKTQDSIFKIYTNRDTFGCREKINIKIEQQPEYENSVISVSVKQPEPIKIEERAGFTTHATYPENCHFQRELNDIVIQGKVLDENNNPVPNLEVFLSTPDSTLNLQYYLTDITGDFHFHLNPYYDGKLLIFKIKENKKVKIIMEDKFLIEIPFLLPRIEVSDRIKELLLKMQMVVDIQKSQNLNRNRSFQNELYPGYRPILYVKPFSVVKPSEYTYLPDFINISHEILPLLKIRYKNSEYVAEIIDVIKNEYVKPLIFLDGILIDSIKQIAHLNSRQISKIEFFPKARYLGNLYLPGIVSVFTTNMEILNIHWLLPTLIRKNNLITPLSEFLPENPEKLDKHTPDFSSLLFWKPSLFFKSNVKTLECYSSDLTGKFEIEIQGITQRGQLIKYSKYIEVISNFLE